MDRACFLVWERQKYSMKHFTNRKSRNSPASTKKSFRQPAFFGTFRALARDRENKLIGYISLCLSYAYLEWLV